VRTRLAAPVAAVLLLLALAVAPHAQSPPQAREIANVAAFARLYGVVRYFYPSDTAAGLDWDRFVVYGVGAVRPAADAPALAAALTKVFGALGPGIAIGATLGPPPATGPANPALVAWRYRGAGIGVETKGGPYMAWRTARAVPARTGPAARPSDDFDALAPSAGAHADVDLGSGLKARVPLALSDAEAASPPAPAGVLLLREAMAPRSAARGFVDQNLADVVVAWNVFRHFYPYWSVVTAETGVDWDARLPEHLRLAYEAADADAQREALETLVADAADGHGWVVDPQRQISGRLPLRLRLVEGQVIVTASDARDVPVGTVIATIDGAPAAGRVADQMRRESGAAQWREVRALQALTLCRTGAPVPLGLESASGARATTVTCGTGDLPEEKRPSLVSELAHGVWYVDLTRAKFSAIEPVLPRLVDARGVVFDVRGYPTDAGIQILSHLIAASEGDRWMHVPRIVGPFWQLAGYDHFGWDLKPAAPRVGGRIVFLTDGRAISYAESVMGYVADRQLGTIVGAPTAGANGNVARVVVPGGMSISFTGMRVTRHDGSSTFHLHGMRPDVAATPTIAGVRAGRDEVLERGLAVIAGQSR